jgi:hypothetical protein
VNGKRVDKGGSGWVFFDVCLLFDILGFGMKLRYQRVLWRGGWGLHPRLSKVIDVWDQSAVPSNVHHIGRVGALVCFVDRQLLMPSLRHDISQLCNSICRRDIGLEMVEIGRVRIQWTS